MNSNIRCTFPYEIQEVDPETNKELSNKFKARNKGFVQVGPEKWVFPSEYKDLAETIYKFKVRPDDIWTVTFPRSGTTVMQEMIWLIANDFDYETAHKKDLSARFPFFDYDFLLNTRIKSKISTYLEDSLGQNEVNYQSIIKDLENKTSRRFIKTHIPFSLLPPNLLNAGCKVIYTARNPKDVVVSFYYLQQLTNASDYQGTFEEYWKFFVNNLVLFSPYWSHIKEGWQRRNENNVLFLFYEDLVKNMRDTIVKVSQFLGKTLTQEQLQQLEGHLSFDNFKKNESVNGQWKKRIGVFNTDGDFIRNGKINEWKEYFTEEMNIEANQWIEKNMNLIDGFKFPV